MDRTPVTEQSHPKSMNIDVSSPAQIVEILSSCDDELFGGFQNSQGLFEEHILKAMERVSTLVSEVLEKPDESVIILSGCGTSGRLAFMVSNNFNLTLKSLNREPCFDYLIAGGDEALFTSQEAGEDDPVIGQSELIEAVGNKRRVVYLGITCGLSAPYVGGQLEYAMLHSDTITPILIGFNPTSLARNTPVEKWNKTFRDVCIQLEEEQCQGQAFIINPVVGPEPITGSSRMKGGSATKILLDSIFTSAFFKANIHTCPDQYVPSIRDLLTAYRFVKNETYKESADLARVIEAVGRNLRHNGHLYYVSDLRCGIVGLIDASECQPTYGVSLEDVRGFIENGYSLFGNKTGDLSEFFDISTEYFTREIIPSLSANDTVIILQESAVRKNIQGSPAAVIEITVSDKQNTAVSCDQDTVDVSICITTKTLTHLLNESCIRFAWNFYTEMALKWACNIISTGSHVLKGKVFQNMMVDVKVSNNKLFHRAVGIIEKLGCSTRDAAMSLLLRAIYGMDDLQSDQLDAALSCHIAAATSQTGIVPIAIVMARTGLTYCNAAKRIEENAVIRKMLSELMPK